MHIVHVAFDLRIEVVTVPNVLIEASLVIAIGRSRASVAPLAGEETTKRCSKAARSLGVESCRLRGSWNSIFGSNSVADLVDKRSESWDACCNDGTAALETGQE